MIARFMMRHPAVSVVLIVAVLASAESFADFIAWLILGGAR